MPIGCGGTHVGQNPVQVQGLGLSLALEAVLQGCSGPEEVVLTLVLMLMLMQCVQGAGADCQNPRTRCRLVLTTQRRSWDKHFQLSMDDAIGAAVLQSRPVRRPHGDSLWLAQSMCSHEHMTA